MKPRHLLLPIAVICLLGARYSPIQLQVYVVIKQMTAGLPIIGPPVIGPFELAWMTLTTIAIATLLLAGLPAALIDRLKRRPDSSRATMALWLLCSLALIAPGLARLL